MHCRSDDHSESVVVYELSPNESFSEGVVTAVAAAANCDPVASDGLDPLATVIDPDALDSLFRTVGADTNPADDRVCFRYHGHTVTADREGCITVAVPSDGTAD